MFYSEQDLDQTIFEDGKLTRRRVEEGLITQAEWKRRVEWMFSETSPQGYMPCGPPKVSKPFFDKRGWTDPRRLPFCSNRRKWWPDMLMWFDAGKLGDESFPVNPAATAIFHEDVWLTEYRFSYGGEYERGELKLPLNREIPRKEGDGGKLLVRGEVVLVVMEDEKRNGRKDASPDGRPKGDGFKRHVLRYFHDVDEVRALLEEMVSRGPKTEIEERVEQTRHQMYMMHFESSDDF